MKRLFVEDEIYGDLRPATPEDLIEALGGEKVWWCDSHNAPFGKPGEFLTCLAVRYYLAEFKTSFGDACRMVERILTPALDQEKVL